MKPKDAKDCSKMLHEIKDDTIFTRNVAGNSMTSVARETYELGKLWREKNKSRLVKIGVTLILLPDPGISNVVGAGLVAAGLLQDKIKNSGLFLEDIAKTYPRLFKELQQARQSLE